MSGKKRKKPLSKSKHKFFKTSENKQPQNGAKDNTSKDIVNVIANNVNAENRLNVTKTTEKLIAVRIMNNRPYFLIQTGTSHQKWHSLVSCKRTCVLFSGNLGN